MEGKDLQTLSVLVSRAALAAKLGSAYEGDRDLYEALGYPETLEFADYFVRYERQDIAKAVIDRPVQATWRNGFELLESNDDQETALEKEFSALSKKLSLVSKFSRVDKLAGMGDYGILLLGFDDVRESSDWLKPVAPGKRKLLYVKPLSEDSAKIDQWEDNTADERYGLVKTYNITITNPGQNSTSTIYVHHTRVIHIVAELLESEVEGIPRLKAVFNRLMDLEKLVGGSAEMFWRGARPGYHGKVDPEFNLTAATEADLKDQIDEYEHNLRRILVNQGIDLQSLQQQLADPSAYVDVQLQMISAVTGIPKRILVGSERGELSSGQDADSWDSYITARRGEFAEECIIRPYVDRLILFDVLPEPKDDYTVQWEDLFAESEDEKVTVGGKRATALQSYSTNPAASSIVPPEAFFEFFLGFTKEQIEVITEMVDASMDDEEKAMSKLNLSPEQIDQVQNPQKYINQKKIIPENEDSEEIEDYGGPGSGNFGHAGRPGKVGGSGVGKATVTKKSEKEKSIAAVSPTKKAEPIKRTDNNLVTDSIERMEKAGRITKAQSDALLTYSGNAYWNINGGLRDGELGKEHKKTVAAIDSAMKRSTSIKELIGDEKIYRAAEIPEIKAALKGKQKLDGIEFTDNAYVSTTTDKKIAKTFQREGSPLLVIKAPTGTRMIDMTEHSQFGSHEAEVLLDRGLRFKVSKTEYITEMVKFRGPDGKFKQKKAKQLYVYVDIISKGMNNEDAGNDFKITR